MNNFYRGLILVEPYGELVLHRSKRIIVKSRIFSTIINKRLLVIQNKIGLCFIELEEPYEINIDKFKKMYKLHKIPENDRISWWEKYKELYVYNITFLTKLKKPILLNYKQGPQVAILPENIEYKKIYIGLTDLKNNYNFNSIEINKTYYNLPKNNYIKSLEKLNLIYSIKVNKLITNYENIKNIKILWINFYKLFEKIHNKIKFFIFIFDEYFLINKNTINIINIFSDFLFLNKNHFYIFEFKNIKWEKYYNYLNNNNIITNKINFKNNITDSYYYNLNNKIFYINIINLKNNILIEKIYNFIKKNNIIEFYIYFDNESEKNGVLFFNRFNKINLPQK